MAIARTHQRDFNDTSSNPPGFSGQRGAISVWRSRARQRERADAEHRPSVQELRRELQQSLQRIEEVSRRVNNSNPSDRTRAGAAQTPAGAAQLHRPRRKRHRQRLPPRRPHRLSSSSIDCSADRIAGAATARAPRVDSLASEVSQLSQSLSRINSAHRRAVHGFIDLGARFFSHTDPGSINGANGSAKKAIDFYLNPELGPRIRSLMESRSETGESSQSVGIDFERLQVGYVASDALTVWIGRFHTPYGYGILRSTRPANPDLDPASKISRVSRILRHDAAHTVGLWATGKRLAAATFSLTTLARNSPRILTNWPAGTGQVDMELPGLEQPRHVDGAQRGL